jgi:hypothetical protein
MSCAPTGSESELVGYWNFEEGSGNTALDLTSNGNNGTITGATYDSNVPVQSCGLTNANGCDSTAILNLTINPSTTSSVSVTECDTYSWNGQAYTSSGVYTYVSTIGNVCVFPETYKEAVLSTTGSCRIRINQGIINKKYFLFFSRAFKQLLKIYEFKKGSSNKVDDYKDIESTHDEDTEAEHKLLLDSYMKLAPKEFNNWFNTMWLETEQTGETSATDLKLNGYGDWLKSGGGCADMGEFAGLSKDDKTALLNKKKRAMSSMVKHQEFGEMMNTSNQSLLCRDEVGGYQSDVFSKLQYDDLKHAHEDRF